MGANIIALAKSRDENGLKQVARNICASQGVDFDKEFEGFKQTFGLFK